jgi:carboxylesterase type B
MSYPVDKCLIGLWVISHVDGLHSNAPITAYAASISQPVITVNIGYRLNWFRSLVFHDVLEEYTASPTGMNGPFNLAIQDQWTAFAWIDEFISGFGGDTSSVTAVAESAGSIFLTYHICDSSTRLFDRAYCSLGWYLEISRQRLRKGEYQALLKHFKIDGATAAERLEALRRIDGEELAQYPGAHLFPYVGATPGVATEDSLFTRGHTNSDEPDESGPHLRVAERCNG